MLHLCLVILIILYPSRSIISFRCRLHNTCGGPYQSQHASKVCAIRNTHDHHVCSHFITSLHHPLATISGLLHLPSLEIQWMPLEKLSATNLTQQFTKIITAIVLVVIFIAIIQPINVPSIDRKNKSKNTPGKHTAAHFHLKG